ncbi:chemotaxis protein CheB [Desulfococcus sp.]|uniref:chemotaxis protein CheB n=1 Tax=Desulfococcus sp. TaxID=2025834 RepID=UPI0035946C41
MTLKQISETHGSAPERVRLLIVDDSVLMRHILCNIFSGAPHIRIVGQAGNGREALSMIPDLDPHVVTLDINMPVMDGVTALKHIMIRHPLPTVMCSTLTREGQKVTFDTLKFGAVDFIHKPSNRHAQGLEAQHQTIIDKITLAAAVDIGSVRFLKTGKNVRPGAAAAARPENLTHICAVGASEGGYGALLKIIPYLPGNLSAAILLIIHDTSQSVGAFIRYLHEESAVRVQRAIDGAPVKPGVCYVASGREYITIEGRASGCDLRVNTSPFPNRRSSINMLLISLAETMKQRAIGLILSGGGHDGAEGLREIARRGGLAMVQSPAASLYKEMPVSALQKTPSAEVLPDRQIAEAIRRHCHPADIARGAEAC